MHQLINGYQQMLNSFIEICLMSPRWNCTINYIPVRFVNRWVLAIAY